MRIDLSCPFEERQAVKALGARWDPAIKRWFVVNPPDLAPFARWLPGDAARFLMTGGDGQPAPASIKPTGKPTKKRKQVPKSPPIQTGLTFEDVDTNPAEPPW